LGIKLSPVSDLSKLPEIQDHFKLSQLPKPIVASIGSSAFI